MENGVGWLNVSLAQRCFDFLSRMNELLVLSSSHLAAKLSKRFGFRSSQCGNLAILCQVNEYEIVTPNKKFKPDYQRAAESALKWFSVYGALLSMTLCVGSSLIWRYVNRGNMKNLEQDVTWSGNDWSCLQRKR
ncbi:hypothetical protein MCT08_16995 [Vibrio aestuarianus]|uniref:hypothetical protein n=1 Tax=Vibrio aestuarianus TaxID=28171 RepID=UPI00237CD19C|nr:hypothetical protein [Vibrio aestuarianus]MDE1251266.1 hypothetical protein [Vibrio aestuarianus]